MDKTQIDIKENYLYRLDHELLAILLKDRSSGKNTIWATDNYRNMSFCRRLQSYVCRPENGPKRSLIIGTVWG